MRVFLDNNLTLACECTGSSFVEKDHIHILTGYIKSITSNKLTKLFSKGTKYQGNWTVDYKKAKKNIITGMHF